MYGKLKVIQIICNGYDEMKYFLILAVVILSFITGFSIKGQNITVSVNPTPTSILSLTPTVTPSLSPTLLPTNTPVPQPPKIVQKSKCTEEKNNAFRNAAKEAGYSDNVIESYLNMMKARNCEPLPPEQARQQLDLDVNVNMDCYPTYGGGIHCY